MLDAGLGKIYQSTAKKSLNILMSTKPNYEKFGQTAEAWATFKAEALAHMSATAARRGMITYGDLAAQMTSVAVQAHDQMLWEIIGDVARDEGTAGRGLLSVVVVHKHGDMEPGKGFFELAKFFKRDTRDRTVCFVEELKTVYHYWSVARPQRKGAPPP
jgi:hypothetical protein